LLKKNMINSEIFDVKRLDIIKNPLILFYLAKYNPNFKKRGPLILSLVANISITFCIILSNYNQLYILPRENLYDNYIINTYPFILTLIMISSLYFFYLLLKFYGVKTIFFICFVCNFISSILFSYFVLVMKEPEDLNNHYLTDKQIYIENSKDNIRLFLGVLTFFGFGLIFTLFFYLMKFTKTIYRCLFLGICHVIFDFILIFAFMSTHFFNVNMHYVTITSMFGMVNTILINGDMGYNIINDFRKIFIK